MLGVEVSGCGILDKLFPLPAPPCSELFNAAFVSCWMELVTAQKEDMVANLKLALSVPNIPKGQWTLGMECGWRL